MPDDEQLYGDAGRQDVGGQRAGFLEFVTRRGYQRFYQPRTCAPGLMNQYGWIDAPKTGDLLIDLYRLRPDAKKTMYWFYESIVTNSTNTIRCALEGNFTWNTTLDDFEPTAWKITTGYAVRADNPHMMSGTVIKTRAGEAMRLRIYGSSGADNDIYFKFVGWELPFAE